MATITVYNDCGEVDYKRSFKRSVISNVKLTKGQNGTNVVVPLGYRGGNYVEPETFRKVCGNKDFTFQVGDFIYFGVLAYENLDVSQVEQITNIHRVTGVEKSYQLNGNVGEIVVEVS